MGYISIEYKIGANPKAPIETIMGEFEYGSTFALYKDHEIIVPGKNHPLDYISYSIIDDSTLKINIYDNFWSIDYFFEKFMSICLYNMLDFGDISINSIDLDNSELKSVSLRSENLNLVTRQRNTAICGTMFKPYYHFPIKQKIEFAKRCIDLGLNIFKNDECYFATKRDLLYEAEQMSLSFSGKADFVPNITSYISDYELIQNLIDSGINIMMVDYLITGIKPVFELKLKFPEITIWGHRIGYHPISKHISMKALSTLAVLGGIDFLHVGTPMSPQIGICKEEVDFLKNEFPYFLPIFTKTTPESISMLKQAFGYDAIYMGCGYFRDSDSNINWDLMKKWRLSL